MPLAHVVRDKTEAAYLHSDLLDRRRKLMDAWARFCAGGKATGQVVPMRRRAE